jgi:hypothetical protein
MLPTFGSLESLWEQVLDPDGDGICSRAEWKKGISRDIGLSGKAAGLIFTALDVVHAGWVAFSELGFLEDFVPAQLDGEEDIGGMDFGSTLMSSSRTGLQQSMSDGALRRTVDAPFASTEFSWNSSFEASASTMARSRMSSTQNFHLGSTQRSSRAMQNRQYANCLEAKYRWMGEAAGKHTRSLSDGSAWATLRKEVHPKMPTVGGTQGTDVFRFTNEFYREGCRRLQFHGSLQAYPGGAQRDHESQSSSQQSPTSERSRSRKNSSTR